MKNIFGTDGIRGKAGKFPIDSLTANKLGKSISIVLKDLILKKSKIGKINNLKSIIAYDTRISSKNLAYSLSAGLSSNNIDVVISGVMPTPSLSYSITQGKFDFGIMITASHNPYHDNGFKIFLSNGEKINQEIQSKIEHELNKKINFIENYGTITKNKKYIKKYQKYIVNSFKENYQKYKTQLPNFKIIFDAANGASSPIIKKICNKLNLNYRIIHASPNGININDNCGCTHLDSLKKQVIKNNFDIGVAVDGDGDRISFIDENGDILDGDHIMAIVYEYLLDNNKLDNKLLITTIASSFALNELVNKNKGKIIRTGVGDPLVLQAMKQNNGNFGGEQSGHIIFLDHLPLSDGIFCALKMIEIILSKKQKLSNLRQALPYYDKIFKNLSVTKKIPIENLKCYSTIKDIENKLKNKGSLLVRYSGTENLLRIFVEGKNTNDIKSYADLLETKINEEIG